MLQKLLQAMLALIFLLAFPIIILAQDISASNAYQPELTYPNYPAANIGVRWLVEPSLQATFVHDFQGGMAAVEIADDGWSWTTVGYINNLGEFVIPIQYRNQHWVWHSHHVMPLHFGYGTAGIFSTEYNESIAFFCASGEQLTPFVFAAAHNFYEGLAAVAVRIQHGNNDTEYRWGFVDTTGELVIPFAFEAVGHFSDGLAAVSLGGYWGFIDTAGNLAIPFSVESLVSNWRTSPPFFVEGRAIVWEWVWETDEDHDPVAAWQRYHWVPERRYGVIDKEGNQITPFIYDMISPFSEGLAAFRVGCFDYGFQWGFIDLYGNEVILPTFDWAGSFVDGLAHVMYECDIARWTGRFPWVNNFIDRYGNVVAEPAGEHLGFNFSEGLLTFFVDGYVGFIDKTGTEVIPPIFHFVGHTGFSNGLAVVGMAREGIEESEWGFSFGEMYFGFIDTAGNFVVPAVFDQVHPFSEGLAWVMYGGYWGILQVVTGEEAYNLPPLFIHQREEPEYVVEYTAPETIENNETEYVSTIENTAPEPPEPPRRISPDTLRTWIIIVLSFAGVATVGFGTGVAMLQKLEDRR